MVRTWCDVASFVASMAKYGLQSKMEFETPIEISILNYKSSQPYRQKKKILVKELRTKGCNFTQNLEMTVVDTDGNHYGMFEVDCGIFEITNKLRQMTNLEKNYPY